MNATRRFLLATTLAFSLVLPAFAAEPYVTNKNVDLTTLLPLPPAKGSALDKAEMQMVLETQAQASDARKKQALEDSEESVYVMFTRVLGDKFTAANTPKLAAMFERIAESEGDTLDPAKPVFGRVRPWIANPEVKAYSKPTKSEAYPSGHTTLVTMTAIVVAAMVPEKRDEIWARAYDYAQSRVVGGMHYPSDIEAGRRAGTAIAAVLFTLPQFQADFAASKVETRAALGL